MKNPFSEAVTEADAQRVLDEMRACSKEELFETLRYATDEERAEGRMNETHMEEIYAQLSPMLSERQRERMREVIRRLKE